MQVQAARGASFPAAEETRDDATELGVAGEAWYACRSASAGRFGDGSGVGDAAPFDGRGSGSDVCDLLVALLSVCRDIVVIRRGAGSVGRVEYGGTTLGDSAVWIS